MATQLVTPETSAIAECFGTIAGCTRCSMPLSVISATPEKLDAVAEVVGRLDVGLA